MSANNVNDYNKPRVCGTCYYWEASKLAANIGGCRHPMGGPWRAPANSTCKSYRPEYFEHGRNAR